MNFKKLMKRLDESNYAKVSDLEKYKSLPLKDRSRKVWYWFGPWYLLPMGLPCDITSFKNLHKKDRKKSQWDLCHEFVSSEFPFQHFLRETIPNSKFVKFFEYKWNDITRFYRKWIYHTFKPLNKSLVKEIPTREWIDVRTMIPNLLYAMVIQFVDEEKCFETVDFYSDGNQESIDFANKLKEVYDYAIVGRHTYQKIIENLLTEASDMEGDLTYEERYGKLNQMETTVKNLEDEHLAWITKNREMFWT